MTEKKRNMLRLAIKLWRTGRKAQRCEDQIMRLYDVGVAFSHEGILRLYRDLGKHHENFRALEAQYLRVRQGQPDLPGARP